MPLLANMLIYESPGLTEERTSIARHGYLSHMSTFLFHQSTGVQEMEIKETSS